MTDVSRWPLSEYHRYSRSATYGFISALPLIVLYEFLIIAVNRGQVSQVRVGAEVWIKQALALVGGFGLYAMGLAVVIVGIYIFVKDRKKQIPIRPKYLAWMILESTVYAVLVAMAVSTMVGALFFRTLFGSAMPEGLGMELALSIGAGIYEELVFRVLLVGGLYALTRRLFSQAAVGYVAAAIVGALVFSAVHYVGALGDVFTLASFSFRFLFGLALNALYLWRGFGIAAWTHALYDVFVVTNLL